MSSHRLSTFAFVLAFILSLGSAAHAAPAVCDPHTYGAKADGVTKDTKAIQAAIDACAKKGGGTVKLSGGTFLSAPIVLKSKITLFLDKDTTLLGSPDHEDYPKKIEFRGPGFQSLVSATNAENITINGTGVIDGNGASWWEIARKTPNSGVLGSENTRPRLVVFDHVKHIVMEGITVQNSPYWQIVPYYSDDITIRNIKVLAPAKSPNTDAIDPFASTHMLIEKVFADVGDDDIAIKSGMINSPGPDSPSADIIIRDCIFLHGHGLSIGSEIAGGAQNILAERIHFKGTDNGVRIKANRDRGADVGHITFRDIDMEDVKTALLISEYYPKVLPEGDNPPMPIGRLTPHFHDITVENLKATGSTLAGVIVGLPEVPIQNVVLKNVTISAQKGMVISDAVVSGSNVHITAAEGQTMQILPSAKVDIK